MALDSFPQNTVTTKTSPPHTAQGRAGALVVDGLIPVAEPLTPGVIFECLRGRPVPARSPGAVSVESPDRGAVVKHRRQLRLVRHPPVFVPARFQLTAISGRGVPPISARRVRACRV